MIPSVEAAIAEIRQAFPGRQIDVDAESQGGAYVVVHDLELGAQYQPQSSWIGFLIQYTYPMSDVYPHFAAADLSRTDGAGLDSAFQRSQWRDRPATQISRRSNRWDPTEDTAALKLHKVLDWIRGK